MICNHPKSTIELNFDDLKPKTEKYELFMKDSKEEQKYART